jgi:hypothetical protein
MDKKYLLRKYLQITDIIKEIILKFHLFFNGDHLVEI